MLIVEMMAKIHGAFFGQGKPIKAICRELRDGTEGRRERSPAGGDRVPLRAREAQPVQKIRPLEGQARSMAIGERREGVA